MNLAKLSDEQLIVLLDKLEEGEKSFTQASYRDLMMTAHTDMFFELGVRDVATMDAGWSSFKKIQNNFNGKVLSVYGKFKAGTTSTGMATTEFQKLLKGFSKDAFMAGTQMVGNKYYSEVGMTKKDLAFVNKYVRAETRHFRKFLNDVKDPKHLPASKIPRNKAGRRLPGYRRQVHSYSKRVGYYADSLRSMGYNGMVAGAGTLLNVYWVLDKLSGRRSPHCEDCVMYAAGNPYSWQTLPTTPRAGDSQCLYRCYCGLEIQQSGKGKEFDIPGSGSTQGLTAPGRWAQVLDKAGRQLGGTAQQDVEAIYQRMYKARQMIEITKGAERLKWIRARQELNNTLLQQSPQLRKLPSVSVRGLTKAVFKAQPKTGAPLGNFVGVRTGERVTFLRGDYFANGKLIRKGGNFIFKDATGVELIVNLEMDIVWTLEQAGFGKAAWRRVAKIAFKDNKLTPKQVTDLNKILGLSSKSGQAALKAIGKTRMEVLEAIAKARHNFQAGTDTKVLHYDTKTQAYTAERARLHDKIIKDFLAKAKKVKPSDQAEFLFTGGRPGSGKSTVLDKVMPGWEGKYIKIDSDAIKKILAQYDGHSVLDFRAALYHNESNDIANRIMDIARRQRKNILYDGTMKNMKKAEYLAKSFDKAGYSVKVVFADLPTNKAVERAVYRFFKEERFVDPAYIMTHGNKNLASFNKIKKYLDEWFHYNTDVPFGDDPILIKKWKKSVALAAKKVSQELLSKKIIKRVIFVDGKVTELRVARMEKGLLKLPQKHLKLIKELHLQDRENFMYDARHAGASSNDAGYYVKYGPPDKMGNIYVQQHQIQTVLHEVGHRVWAKGLTWRQQEWWTAKFEQMAAGRLKSPSAYARRNVGEFFAECYSYHYSPQGYHRPAWEVQQWIKNNFY